MDKKILILLLVVLLSLSVMAQSGTLVVKKELTANNFKGNENIVGDVNLYHDFNHAFRLFVTNEFFTAEPDKIYNAQHRMVNYRNASNNCFWYNTIQLIEQENQKKIIDKIVGYESSCNVAALDLRNFKPVDVKFTWSETVPALPPKPELTSDKTKAFAPVSVGFVGTCNPVTETSSIKECSIAFGDGEKQAFTGASSHVYKKAGSYTAELTAVDNFGNKGTVKLIITAEELLSKITDFKITEKELTKIVFDLACENKTNAGVSIKSNDGNVIKEESIECDVLKSFEMDVNLEKSNYVLEVVLDKCEQDCVKNIPMTFEEKKEVKTQEQDSTLYIIIIAAAALLVVAGLLVYHFGIKKMKRKKEGL